MPQQSKQPDFIPAASTPDFIPAEAPAQTAEPDDRNRLQKAFDAFTTVTPEQEKGHSYPVNAMQHLGAGLPRVLTPLFHPEQALEKASDALVHPQETLGETIQGVKSDPWGTAGTMIGGAALGGAMGKAAGPILDKIPTRAKAGAVFQDLNQKLANQPVSLTSSDPHMQQLEKIGATGPGVPTTVGKLLDRSRMLSPMNYPEARLFQENLSGPSTTEKMGMSGSMKGGVKQLNKAFYEDIKNAADAQGMGEDYAKAMRDYRRAAQMSNVAKKVGKAAAIGGAGAIGAGAGYRLVKDLMQ